VVDDEDLPVAVGQTGHLLARGPYTIRGYYRAAEHNRAAFTLDGFYRTRDLVRMTASGSVVVVGRAKEQTNRAGEKVAPAELERHLGTHPQVLAVAVLGLSDPVLGQRIAAFVETSNDVALGKAELQGFLRARGIAEYKLPDEVHCAPDLPRTSAGK